MKYFSTNNCNNIQDLRHAVMYSLADDKGLFMPETLPMLDASFFQGIRNLSFVEIAFEVAKPFVGDEIPNHDLKIILERAVSFSAPLVWLNDEIAALELWHGPSLAFKDFGARFMAELLTYFNKENKQKQSILVATSGDTGGAVANAISNAENVELFILYPKDKISEIQKWQLTSSGNNIHALEIDGSFDDCQAMVKQAFLDAELKSVYQFCSANSINIARLIPQCFYYFEAYKQACHIAKDIVISVPSGNFGNLTAGLMAKKMGLPIKRFIAATNMNTAVPEYLQTGLYKPKPTIPTISNAMDVGNPSNFPRILALYNNDLQALRRDVSGFYLDDEQTINAINELFVKYNYVCDPHGAIAYKALENIQDNELGLFLETAHPVKFHEIIKESLGISLEIPSSLSSLADKTQYFDCLEANFKHFKKYLLQRI